MSLIRCLSNAEGLYIYGDGSCYNVSTGRYWDLSNTGPDDPVENCMRIPNKVFEQVAREWLACWGTKTVEVDGFKVESDVNIFVEDLEPVPPGWGIHEIMLLAEEHTETFWGLKLTYQRPDKEVDGETVTPEELYIYLYKVTWCYAIRSFEEPEKAEATEETETGGS